MFEHEGKRIYIAGHRGLVGGAILRRSQVQGAGVATRKHDALNLTDQVAVRAFMAAERTEVVIMAAAKFGGILVNDTYPADFIYENLMIECNLIHQAFAAGVRRLLQFGSSCIHPRAVTQPMREDALHFVLHKMQPAGPGWSGRGGFSAQGSKSGLASAQRGAPHGV
ncbi:MAG: NAD-dependent epimerase/dehydratase family protein [Limimaricola sp.]|nr:NAD-dependent epimerase/dehydratase family protein [Limimaricola sp.]